MMTLPCTRARVHPAQAPGQQRPRQLDGQFKALRDDGYDGTMSLETGYSRPDGNKVESTRECLEGLFRVLKSVDAMKSEVRSQKASLACSNILPLFTFSR